MTVQLDRWTPLTCDGRQEGRWLLWGLLAGAAINLRFLLAYASARHDLFEVVGGIRRLTRGAMLPPFSTLLSWSLLGCFAAAAAMVPLAAWHYASHFHGSRSIYRMRRLPNRWELPRRCLALPAAGAAAYLLEAAALLLLDFAIYHLATPAGCVPPGQWAALWGL